MVHYSNRDEIEQEASHDIPDHKPPPDWPTAGCIDFKNVSLSYRPGLPSVLRDITFSVKGGDKIGIVGRTGELHQLSTSCISSTNTDTPGAGKSSLALSLLRIVEFSGSVSIDG